MVLFLLKNKLLKKVKKYYNIILFEKGNKKYTKEELYFGRNHVDKKMLKEKNLYLLKKYNKIKNKLPKDPDILEEIKLLEKS